MKDINKSGYKDWEISLKNHQFWGDWNGINQRNWGRKTSKFEGKSIDNMNPNIWRETKLARFIQALRILQKTSTLYHQKTNKKCNNPTSFQLKSISFQDVASLLAWTGDCCLSCWPMFDETEIHHGIMRDAYHGDKKDTSIIVFCHLFSWWFKDDGQKSYDKKESWNTWIPTRMQRFKGRFRITSQVKSPTRTTKQWILLEARVQQEKNGSKTRWCFQWFFIFFSTPKYGELIWFD